jgi:hypothetical protein
VPCIVALRFNRHRIDRMLARLASTDVAVTDRRARRRAGATS